MSKGIQVGFDCGIGPTTSSSGSEPGPPAARFAALTSDTVP